VGCRFRHAQPVAQYRPHCTFVTVGMTEGSARVNVFHRWTRHVARLLKNVRISVTPAFDEAPGQHVTNCRTYPCTPSIRRRGSGDSRTGPWRGWQSGRQNAATSRLSTSLTVLRCRCCARGLRFSDRLSTYIQTFAPLVVERNLNQLRVVNLIAEQSNALVLALVAGNTPFIRGGA